MADERIGVPVRTTRRTLLAGAGSLGLAALGARQAAAAEQVVVATWGGDYANLLHINIEKPLLEPKGIKVIQDVGDEPPRLAKLFATRHLPRGSVDVACFEAPTAYLAASAGLLEPLDETKIPNLKHVTKGLGTSTFAPNIYSPQVIIYDPEKITTPPKSFADLLDPKYKGKVGFPDGNFFYAMMAANLYAGSGPDDFDKGKPVIEKLNGNELRLYPSTDSIAQAFKSGEIEIGLMWLARVVMWQNAGIKVQGAFPAEGAMLYVTGMCIPKNAPDKTAAYAYIDGALAPQAQQGFAQRMGYLPTIDDAALPPALAKRLALPAPAPKLVSPDYAYTTKVQNEMSEWWKKTVQSRG